MYLQSWLVLGLLGCAVAVAAEKDEPKEPLAPVEYLAHLQQHGKKLGAYTAGFDGPIVREVREEDLDGLVERLDSKERCAATIKAGLARLPAGSTVGHEAAVLLDSFRTGKAYPIGKASTDHKVDAGELRKWFDDRQTQLCIRDGAGRLLVSSDEIVGYDWATHTILLRKGIGQELRKKRLGKPKLTQPFVAALGSDTNYAGELVSPLSSQSVDKVVIVLDILPDAFDRLKLELGYASAKAFPVDLRDDARIKKSLDAAKKLK